jgi:4-aminobutyrate aminotransferase
MLDHVRTLGEYTLRRLEDLKARHRIVKDVRGLGLILGIELQDVSPNLAAAEAAEQVMYRSLEKGLNFKVTNGTVLTLTPALTIQSSEMDEAIDILDSVIKEIEDGQ